MTSTEAQLRARKTYYNKNRLSILEKTKDQRAAYKRTPRGRYNVHRSNAKKRNIPFLLTFEEWWSIWQESGKWEQRGKRSNQYQMCRNNDEGSYEVGNVRIDTCYNNSLEWYKLNGTNELGQFKSKFDE